MRGRGRTAAAPTISVIVCTRDRPEHLARCLDSILASEYADLELVVVDQSTTDASSHLLAACEDDRLVVLRLEGPGKSRALNAAMAAARGEILALTDDDCAVPKDWLRRALTVLAAEPQASIVFGALAAAPHDRRKGYVPAFSPERYQVFRRPALRSRLGMGGNMVVRRSVFRTIGAFDEAVGPGSRFRSGDDLDLAYRALRRGHVVVNDPANVVIHWGMRDYATGAAQRLVANYHYGIGAIYARHAVEGDRGAAGMLGAEMLRLGSQVLLNGLRCRPPLGARSLAFLILGAAAGVWDATWKGSRRMRRRGPANEAGRAACRVRSGAATPTAAPAE
jgi:glycosyltransferase involved in cell wall biosynthesis